MAKNYFHFTKRTRWSQAVGSTHKLCITMDREQRFERVVGRVGVFVVLQQK